VAKLTTFTHKTAIQLHLVAESCTICISRSRRPVRKRLDTLSYAQCLRVQSPSREANSHLTHQEIPRLLCKPKVHYRVLVTNLSQMKPFHTLPPYFCKIHSDINILSTSRSSEWSPPFKLPDQRFVFVFHCSTHAACPADLILLDFITLI
jgi:hypothetical protein